MVDVVRLVAALCVQSPKVYHLAFVLSHVTSILSSKTCFCQVSLLLLDFRTWPLSVLPHLSAVMSLCRTWTVAKFLSWNPLEHCSYDKLTNYLTNNKEINIHETIIENEITTTTTVIYNQIIGTIKTMLVLYILLTQIVVVSIINVTKGPLRHTS